MADTVSLPLHERIPRKNSLKRLSILLILFLLLSLLSYRLLNLTEHGIVWLLAFLCESWFTFIWFLNLNLSWTPVDYKSHPQRLLERFPDLPAVDMFVTTADSSIEPPIITVDTVLSLLAVDYPANKLACYVSDDGCSPITFHALVEASKFAKSWVPFCKKHGLLVRAPSAYFSTEPETHSPDFVQEWRTMKEKYQKLEQRIEETVPSDITAKFPDFSKVERGNHPSIVKVIWENKEKLLDGVPHLIYIAREKRPKYPHHFKAGALNVMTRVSGVMTNAPFTLMVDCDVFVNNPKVIQHAMCLLLGTQTERESAFVQFPQYFYGGLKDDPFGNHLDVLQDNFMTGTAGIQGPLHGGTGCFHRRKILYGLSPDYDQIPELYSTEDKLNLEALRKRFGNSIEFLKSAARAMSSANEETQNSSSLASSLKAAMEVAGCSYELNTCWGNEAGWVYGSTTEDALTGIRIHSIGWESVYCTPDPPAFMGSVPTGGPTCMKQQKRWATGLLEIFVASHGPVAFSFTKRLRFRQYLAYMTVLVWALRSIPEFSYSVLPAFCLLTNTSFLPKVTEPALFIFASVFLLFHLHTLSEYLSRGLSVRQWWNNIRMQRITSATAWLFAISSVLLKILGISETVFEITRKDQNAPDSNCDTDAGRFTFDSSPLFVPGTTLVLLHATALVASVSQVKPSVSAWPTLRLPEMICSLWLLLCFTPFVKGLFRKGSYGIPRPTIYTALSLAFLFVHFSKLVRPYMQNS